VLRYLVIAGLILSGIADSVCQTVSVDPDDVLRTGADQVVGINVNFLRDADANRLGDARPLVEALRDMGARWLRYPGGEKSDWHFFAAAPYAKPDPQAFSWYGTVKGERLDFDQYIEIVREVGAEPYVVVAYDSVERTGVDRQTYLEHAVGWVRYAKEKGYEVRYWEIGNENWHHGTATPGVMAEVVREFSEAMKAVDPAIKTGSNGSNKEWWDAFLPSAAAHLDFISVSHYNAWGWKAYDFYPERPSSMLIRDVRRAIKAIEQLPEPARDRIELVVAETNSKDYSENGWPDDNDLGHAIVAFDTLGQLIQQPKVTAAMLWNTRWMEDTDASKSLFYGLGPANEFTPTGRAVAIWGNFAEDLMVAATSDRKSLQPYVTRSTDGERLTLFLINKSVQPVEKVSIMLPGDHAYRVMRAHRFEGSGSGDLHPEWTESVKGVEVQSDRISLPNVSGPSVTVVFLRRVE